MRVPATNFWGVPRLCERPGCSAPATVTYGFDTSELSVWLAPFEPDEKARPYGSGILCRRHADALAVPRGWHVDDRREAVPRLFLAPPVSEPPVPAAKVRPIREKKDRVAETSRELFEAATNDASEPELEETRAMPWSPKLIEELEDEVPATADDAPKGGLLSRAFGNKDRRERH